MVDSVARSLLCVRKKLTRATMVFAHGPSAVAAANAVFPSLNNSSSSKATEGFSIAVRKVRSVDNFSLTH